jgi:hypothetical protein
MKKIIFLTLIFAIIGCEHASFDPAGTWNYQVNDKMNLKGHFSDEQYNISKSIDAYKYINILNTKESGSINIEFNQEINEVEIVFTNERIKPIKAQLDEYNKAKVITKVIEKTLSSRCISKATRTIQFDFSDDSKKALITYNISIDFESLNIDEVDGISKINSFQNDGCLGFLHQFSLLIKRFGDSFIDPFLGMMYNERVFDVNNLIYLKKSELTISLDAYKKSDLTYKSTSQSGLSQTSSLNESSNEKLNKKNLKFKIPNIGKFFEINETSIFLDYFSQSYE